MQRELIKINKHKKKTRILLALRASLTRRLKTQIEQLQVEMKKIERDTKLKDVDLGTITLKLNE